MNKMINFRKKEETLRTKIVTAIKDLLGNEKSISFRSGSEDEDNTDELLTIQSKDGLVDLGGIRVEGDFILLNTSDVYGSTYDIDLNVCSTGDLIEIYEYLYDYLKHPIILP